MCRQNRLKPAGMKLTCKTYDRYRPPLAGNLSPCIFSYKPHSLPSANNLLPGLTGQACDNFSSRRLRRRPQPYGFQPFAFFFYFLSIFFVLYFSCFFCFFLFFLLFSIFSIIQYTEFLFFRIFFADFHKKQHPLLDAVRFLVQFFFGVFIQKILCILILK